MAFATLVALTLNGQPKAIIVVPTQPSPAAVEGAQILADHLFQISGARLEVRRENELGEVTVEEGRLVPPGALGGVESFILVGEGDLAKRLGITSDGLGPGGLCIRTQGNVLALLGPDTRTPSDPWGTRHAVTTFLEEALGVRYLWPGELGKVVPKQATITVPAMEIRFTPMLAQRQIRSMGYGERLQQGLDRLNLTKEDYLRTRAEAEKTVSTSGSWFAWQRMGGSLNLASGHAFGHLWHQYGKEHPEWFAMQPDGSRDQSKSPDRPRLCKSNPELIAAIAREKIEELRRNPDRHSVSVGPNDGGYTTFCMCPNCKALDPPEGRKIKLLDTTKTPRQEFEYVSLTDRMVYFWNAIAERVTKVYPDALLTADAYSAYSAPPVKRKLHPNLVIRFVPISYSSDAARQRGLADWDAWAAMASKIYFRPNLLLLARREGVPIHFAHKMAEDFRYLAHHRMIGTDFDSCVQNWATEGLNYYVLARLHWNPDADVDAIIDDYCRSGFGPAAPHIRRYWDRVEALTNQVAKEELGVTEPYTPEVIAELRAILADADKAAANDEVIRRRIAFLRRGVDFAEIQGEAYRMVKAANEGKPVDKAAAARLMERKYLMMQDIFRRDHLAINVGYLCWGEWGRFRVLGWTGPSADTLKRIKEADEQGRPIPVPAP